jgi:hypothetical protein
VRVSVSVLSSGVSGSCSRVLSLIQQWNASRKRSRKRPSHKMSFSRTPLSSGRCELVWTREEVEVCAKVCVCVDDDLLCVRVFVSVDVVS